MAHEESVLSSFSLLGPTGLNMAIYKPNPQLQSYEHHHNSPQLKT
jgi:hypothetical protein